MIQDGNPCRDGFIRIDLEGNDPNLWKTLRPVLIAKVHALLETVINHRDGTTVADEAKQISAALLDHAKERLAKAGLENEKIEAEVSHLHAQTELKRAEAKKIDAEAEAILFKTSIKKLIVALGMTKVVVVGQENEEAIVFSRQVEAFIESLKSLEFQ